MQVIDIVFLEKLADEFEFEDVGRILIIFFVRIVFLFVEPV